MYVRLVFTYIYFYVCVSSNIPRIERNISEPFDKNVFYLRSFLYDYISYMKWRQLYIIVLDDRFSPRDLQLHLSSQGIQSAVLNTFNRLFGRLKFDYGVTNLIVIGEMNHVVYATNQIMKSNVLKLKSNVVVLCVDCKAVPKLRNPRDIYGNVLWAIPDNAKMSTSLILHEMWYNYPNKEFYTNVIGKWRLNVGIAIGSLIVNQRLNLQGATLHLQAVLTDLDDRNMLRKKADNTLEGLVIDIVSIMAEKLNFSYHVANVCNYSTIDLPSVLKNQDYDMTLFPVTMTPNRLGVVEFTSPFLNEVLLIGIARSTFREESLYLWLFRSFKTSVWITVIVVVAVISCVRMVTKWKHPSDSNDEGWLVIFYLMLQQGMPGLPTAQSSKIVIVTGYLTCWLVFAFYTATLISSLTCNKPYEITIHEAKECNREIGLVDGSTKEFLETTNDPLLITLSKRTFNILRRENYADSFCKREWIFIGSEATLRRLLRDNTRCEIQFSKEAVYRTSNHFAVRKDDVFTKRISKVLRTLHENGIIGRLQRKYFQSISKEESQFIEIEISHLYVLLVILGIGVAASFCVMVIERYML